MLKGAIFDADGTLLDSMPIWQELGQRYLTIHGITAEQGLSDILYAMSLEESSCYLKETYGLPDSVERITGEILALIRSFYMDEVTLKEGVTDYLRYLHERNIPMIVATSNDKALLHSAFVRLRIDRYFQDILTCSELNTNKREPMIYLKAAQKMGAHPQKTAVFEDVLYGIQSAKNGGFITVAVDDLSNQSETEQLRRTADYFIRDFSDPILQPFDIQR